MYRINTNMFLDRILDSVFLQTMSVVGMVRIAYLSKKTKSLPLKAIGIIAIAFNTGFLIHRRMQPKTYDENDDYIDRY